MRRNPLSMRPNTSCKSISLALLAWILTLSALQAQPIHTVDLAGTSTNNSGLQRVYGSVGFGNLGVPVAGGFNVDGDKAGANDYAIAAMTASPLGRTLAGEVYLVFGDGKVNGVVDTANPVPRILPIIGDQVRENAGSEIWMGDVTGDGLGDLLICRQNYSPDGTRVGAGALTILVGNEELRAMAATGETLDLRDPPSKLPIVTILGDSAGLEDTKGAAQTVGERFCIWVRTGDITGDGITDFAIGADRRASHFDPTHHDAGAVYLFRGGSHFETTQTIDLADFGSVAVGNVMRLRPPSDCDDDDGDDIDCHFGATVNIGNLDNSAPADIFIATALNRAGASLDPDGGDGNGTGGSANGSVYIAWDDNFTGDWDPTPDYFVGSGAGSTPGTHTRINGDPANEYFGEELLGGKDLDNDGNPDLMVGDLTAEGFGSLPDTTSAGLVHIIYQPASLKNQEFDLAAPPPGFSMATFQGPVAGALAGDTGMHGDFNDDGIDDVAFSSPHDNPLGRNHAGTIHILLGRNGQWPAENNLNPDAFPNSSDVHVLEIYGALGSGDDGGDTLCYSAAEGDLNGDGVPEIITNEMLGNGLLPGTEDVGNLILLDIPKLFGLDNVFVNGFEGD